jgi:hypothetical protein
MLGLEDEERTVIVVLLHRCCTKILWLRST